MVLRLPFQKFSFKHKLLPELSEASLLYPLLGGSLFQNWNNKKTNTKFFESKDFGVQFSSTNTVKIPAFQLQMQRTLELTQLSTICKTLQQKQETDKIAIELGKNMKVNMDIRKILWLSVEYKDFRSDRSTMQERLVTFKWGKQPRSELW